MGIIKNANGPFFLDYCLIY